MYEFERQKGESITAYSSFIKYREGEVELKIITKRQQNQIAEWKNKWNWTDRKSKYEEHISSKKNGNRVVSNGSDLQSLLEELRTLLTDKIRLSETEELSADNLAKLISLTSKAITDIIKTERELITHTKDDNDWSEIADKIRNNPKAMKLADELSDMVL